MLEARAEWHWVSLGLQSKQNQQFLSTLTLPLLPKDKNKDWMALLDHMPLPLGKPYVPLPALVAHTCQAGENLQCPRNKACSSDVHNRPFSKPSFSPCQWLETLGAHPITTTGIWFTTFNPLCWIGGKLFCKSGKMRVLLKFCRGLTDTGIPEYSQVLALQPGRHYR